MKKLVCSQVLLLMLLFSWQSVGHAVPLKYDFSGAFDISGPLIGQLFSGFFQYDTDGDPAFQNDLSSVTVNGNTYTDSASRIMTSPSGFGVQTTGLDGSLWQLDMYFSQPIDLTQNLPLSFLISSRFLFTSSPASYGNLDSLVDSQASIPDPSMVFLLGCACLLGAGLRRRFKK